MGKVKRRQIERVKEPEDDREREKEKRLTGKQSRDSRAAIGSILFYITR